MIRIESNTNVEQPPCYDHQMLLEARMMLGVSQPIMARLLCVKLTRYQSWEQDLRSIPPEICRLIQLISRHGKGFLTWR